MRQNRLLETRMGRLQSELRKAQCDLQRENKGVCDENFIFLCLLCLL